jgi:hypothetical protein
MHDTCIEMQIYNFKYYETGFNIETGINDKICKIIEFLQKTNDLDYLNLLTDAIEYIRGIRGLRDLSYSALFILHHNYPNLVISLLNSFVFYENTSIGSWKDVRNYAIFCRKYNSEIPIEPILSMYNNQLKHDYELYKKYNSNYDILPRNYLSFAAKYVPRESKYSEFFNFLVSDWFNISSISVTSWHRMSYRKIVSTLNKAIDTLEIRMCNCDWVNINGIEIPYIALELNRNNLTNKSQHLRNYYQSNDNIYKVPHYFVQNPWKIVKNVICEKDIDAMNLYWQEYINMECTKDYYIPVLDLSPALIVNQKTMCVAIAKAMTFAAKSHFGNRVLTYSQKIVWVDLENYSLDIALKRMLGPGVQETMNIQGCSFWIMNLLLDAFKSSNMTEDDLETIKIMLITNKAISVEKMTEIKTLWSSIGKLHDGNFIQIIL